jgi:hypothetical protein
MIQYPRVDPVCVIPEHRNILFHWMPKCAGHSIGAMLKATFGPKFQDYNNQFVGLSFDSEVRVATFFHCFIPSLVANGFLPQLWYDNAFGFAIARNTWDRMVSLFHYLKQQRYLGGTYLDQSVTFDKFIETVVTGKHPKPGPLNLIGYYQANSLLDWLRPDGVWLPHHVARFESLADEWVLICQILGIECNPLPVVGKSKHRPYQEYYSGRTRHLIAEYFAEEISVFEFVFD